MLVKAVHRTVEAPKPFTFAGLMEMYEANYIRFRLLCPRLASLEPRVVSRVPGALALHLRVTECSRYTSTVRLTYYLGDVKNAWRPEPNLKIRVYHDALQAEVLSRRGRHGEGELRAGLGLGDSELALRWRLNRFLYKWLGYCHHQGHRFGEALSEGLD